MLNTKNQAQKDENFLECKTQFEDLDDLFQEYKRQSRIIKNSKINKDDDKPLTNSNTLDDFLITDKESSKSAVDDFEIDKGQSFIDKMGKLVETIGIKDLF